MSSPMRNMFLILMSNIPACRRVGRYYSSFDD